MKLKLGITHSVFVLPFDTKQQLLKQLQFTMCLNLENESLVVGIFS